MSTRRRLAAALALVFTAAPLFASAQEARQDAIRFDVEQQARDAGEQRTAARWMTGAGVVLAAGGLIFAAPVSVVIAGGGIVLAGIGEWRDAHVQLAHAATARRAAKAGADLHEVLDLLDGADPAWSGTALRRDLSKRGALAPADGTSVANQGFRH